MQHQFTIGFGNRKVGEGALVIGVSSDTCHKRCGQWSRCYFKTGYMLWAWQKLDARARGMTLADLIRHLKLRFRRQTIRYGMMGDLPGEGPEIDIKQMTTLTKALTANSNTPFTFTHKEVLNESNPTTITNRELIAAANAQGFVVNLSADTLEEADRKAELGIGPVAVVVENFASMPKKTPGGRPIVACLEEQKGWNVATCTGAHGTIACRWCLKKGRKFIVAFSANPADKKHNKAEKKED